MNERQRKERSRFLSLVLRHRPERVGVTLDSAGWVDVERLLEQLRQHRRPLTRPQLEEIVETSNKQRFAFSEDGLRIRANQGHSVEVNLELQPQAPPAELLHGTVAAALDAILEHGLQKMNRHHVHLSANLDTATQVGGRRGKPVILRVDAQAMHAAGHVFYVTENGVWLTDSVPPAFITLPSD